MAGTITFSGLASGLDTSSWVDALVSVKQGAITSMESNKVKQQELLNIVNNIKSYFSSFQSCLQKVTDCQFGINSMDLFAQNIAHSSNTNILTATATTEAARQSYEVLVKQLATTTKAKSGITETSEKFVTLDTTMKDLGVESGMIKVGDESFNILESTRIETLISKFKGINVVASFKDGKFTVGCPIDQIDDNGTGLKSALKLQDTQVQGYHSTAEIQNFEPTFAGPGTTFASLGLKINTHLTLKDPDNTPLFNGIIKAGSTKDYKIGGYEFSTIGDFFSILTDDYGATDASINNGNITISGIQIDVISSEAGNIKDVLNLTGSSTSTKITSDPFSYTTFATGSTLLSELGVEDTMTCDVHSSNGNLLGNLNDISNISGYTIDKFIEKLNTRYVNLGASFDEATHQIIIDNGYIEGELANILEINRISHSTDEAITPGTTLAQLGLGENETVTISVDDGEPQLFGASDRIQDIIDYLHDEYNIDMSIASNGAITIDPSGHTMEGTLLDPGNILGLTTTTTTTTTNTYTGTLPIHIQNVLLSEFHVDSDTTGVIHFSDGTTASLSNLSNNTINGFLTYLNKTYGTTHTDFCATIDTTTNKITIEGAYITGPLAAASALGFTTSSGSTGIWDTNLATMRVLDTGEKGAIGLKTANTFTNDIQLAANKVFVANAGNLGQAISENAIIGISDAATLMSLATLVNNGNDCSGKTFVLTNDIDLSDITNWTPIGNSSSNQFNGTFDGQGHTINGLSISTSSDCQGLFGFTNINATIKNVGIEDCDISCNAYSGALVGSNMGTITNCYSTGTVTGNNCMGGLVGCNNGGSIDHSYSSCTVDGSTNVGGLAGYNNGSINYSFATGTVIGSSIYIGGLVGSNVGSINNSYTTNNVSHGTDHDLFCGSNDGNITCCYTTGTFICHDLGNDRGGEEEAKTKDGGTGDRGSNDDVTSITTTQLNDYINNLHTLAGIINTYEYDYCITPDMTLNAINDLLDDYHGYDLGQLAVGGRNRIVLQQGTTPSSLSLLGNLPDSGYSHTTDYSCISKPLNHTLESDDLLSYFPPGFNGGIITINGESQSFYATDTIQDILDFFNDDHGVTASLDNGQLSLVCEAGTTIGGKFGTWILNNNLNLSGTSPSGSTTYTNGSGPHTVNVNSYSAVSDPLQTNTIDLNTTLFSLGVTQGGTIEINGVINDDFNIDSNTNIGDLFTFLEDYNITGDIIDNQIVLTSNEHITLANGSSNAISQLGLDDPDYTTGGYTGHVECSTTTGTSSPLTLGTTLSQLGLDNIDSLSVTLDPENSFTIPVSPDTTIEQLIDELNTNGAHAMLDGGVLKIDNSIDGITINGTDNLINILGLNNNDNLYTYSTSSEILKYSTTSTGSVCNVIDNNTKLADVGIKSGSMSIFVDGVKSAINIDASSDFGHLFADIKNALGSDANVGFIDENGNITTDLALSTGKIGIEYTGHDIKIGATNDTSNFANIMGLTKDTDSKWLGSRILYKANINSKLTDSGLFVNGEVTQGTFTLGNATITIDGNTTIKSLINQINSNPDSLATASWDSLSGTLILQSTVQGEAYMNIESGESNFTEIFGFTSKVDGVEILNTDLQELGHNAIVEIDGNEIISSTNIIDSSTSLIQGLTLNLKKVSQGEIVTVTVEQDSEKVYDAVNDVVDSYNTLMKKLDEEIDEDGSLNNDSIMKMLRNNLKHMITQSVGSSPLFRNISAIGISTGKASNDLFKDVTSLVVDKSKFIEALQNNSDEVKKLLVGDTANGSTNGVFMKILNTVDNSLKSTGYLTTKENSINKTITRLDNKISNATVALEHYRAQLEAKFSNMESIISAMQNSYANLLTQQN